MVNSSTFFKKPSNTRYSSFPNLFFRLHLLVKVPGTHFWSSAGTSTWLPCCGPVGTMYPSFSHSNQAPPTFLPGTPWGTHIPSLSSHLPPGLSVLPLPPLTTPSILKDTVLTAPQLSKSLHPSCSSWIH